MLRWRFMFRRLGDRSRYQRFLGIRKNLGSRELDHLTSVDHWHHEALIAWSPLPRAPIGVTRYVRRDQFDVAELAIAVVDEWQRRGVGRALVLALGRRARAAGVRRFTATTLANNPGALALARWLGPSAVIEAHGDVVEVLVELGASRSTVAPTCATRSGA